jgi:hypothetical protein
VGGPALRLNVLVGGDHGGRHVRGLRGGEGRRQSSIPRPKVNPLVTIIIFLSDPSEIFRKCS